MIIIIVLALIVGLALALLIPAKRKHGGFVEREVLTRAEYLDQQRDMAKAFRCGDMSRKGVRSCHRGPNRPCVPGCRGRLDIDTDWKG